MWQADFMGLDVVAGKIRGYEQKHGPRWALAPLIAQLGADKKTFASLAAKPAA